MNELKVWFEYLLKNPGKNISEGNKAKIGLLYNVLGRFDKRIRTLENIEKTLDVYRESLENMRSLEDRLEVVEKRIKTLEEKPNPHIVAREVVSTQKYKTVVKSKEELLKWFKDDGYKKNMNCYRKNNCCAFLFEMFEYCDKEINIDKFYDENHFRFDNYHWHHDWLKQIPVEEKTKKTEVTFPEIITQREWVSIKERMKDHCKSTKGCEGLERACIFDDFCSDILKVVPRNWD